MPALPRAGGSRPHAGFTLVELIAVLTIAAILAAMAGPRLLSSTPFAEGGYADEIVAALRQARSVAIASECPVRFSIDTNGYAAMQPAPSSNRCGPPGTWTTPVHRGDGRDLAGWPPNSANVPGPRSVIFATDGALSPNVSVSIPVGTRTVIVDGGGWVTRQ